MIDVLEIQEKHKIHLVAMVSPEDFTCREIGKADPSVVVSDPTISLYCLDHLTRRALFVQVAHDVDVAAGAFLYLAQYEHARRIFAVPYEVFHRLAAGIDLSAPLVFIHSTGRAGSTLMSKVFGEMEAVTSLSEPDIYTQLVAMRLPGGQDDEIQDLLTSATRILFNPVFTRGSTLNVVKFRSFCIEVADLLSAAFPQAGALFLYRDLGAYIRSAMSAFAVQDLAPEVGRALVATTVRLAPLVAKELKPGTDLDWVEALCLVWLSAIQTYAHLHQQGIPMLAVRYEDLKAAPSRMLGIIAGYLGLPSARLGNALRAFERDSQAGSPASREEAARHTVQIDSHQWDLVLELLRRYPIVGAELPPGTAAVPG